MSGEGGTAQVNGAALPDAPPEPADPVKAMLAELSAREDLKAIFVGIIDKNGKSSLRMTPMSLPEAGHLARLFSVRVDSEYEDMMRGGLPSRAPVSTAGHQARPPLTPKEVQVLAGAMKRKAAAKKKARPAL